MTRSTIIIDDEDRSSEPSKPWTATALDEEGVSFSSGVGATVADAIRDLLHGADWSEIHPEEGGR